MQQAGTKPAGSPDSGWITHVQVDDTSSRGQRVVPLLPDRICLRLQSLTDSPTARIRLWAGRSGGPGRHLSAAGLIPPRRFVLEARREVRSLSPHAALSRSSRLRCASCRAHAGSVDPSPTHFPWGQRRGLCRPRRSSTAAIHHGCGRPERDGRVMTHAHGRQIDAHAARAAAAVTASATASAAASDSGRANKSPRRTEAHTHRQWN